MAVIYLFLLALTLASAQDNVQTRIPEALRECYQDPRLMNRDSRLPMTMNVLIDLIRKVEDSPNGNNMDIRTIGVALIHRFRMDGIIRSSSITSGPQTLPYSPTGYQFSKHKLLLSRLLPGNAFLFPNDSMSSVEKCSLHHILSSTVADEARGDEGIVCNRLAQYRTLRIPRDTDENRHRMSDDVEYINQENLSRFNARRGKYQNFSPAPTDDNGFEIIPGVAFDERNTAPRTASQCPAEDGVVYTQWGAVAAGTVVAGIAAGIEQQNVPLSALVQTNQTLVIDNKFAATLSGDLAEVALRQGPREGPVSIGAAGGWNSTQAPRWYFIQQSTNYESSDAEIRGGLDGLILGSYIVSFRQASSTLKLSQLLDMYYSQRGVFSEQFRACNRKTLLATVAPSDVLLNQVVAFTNYLDSEMPHPATIFEDGLRDYATSAVTAFSAYVPSNLNDLSCATTANSASGVAALRASTDLFIVIDTTWNYGDIYPSIAYLLDNVDVGKYGSNVTLLNARDGSVLVNSTRYLSEFHEQYDILTHQQAPAGFDLPAVLVSLRNITGSRMESNRASGWSGGQSAIVLFLLNQVAISDADINFSVEQTKIFYEQVPDLYFLFSAAGNRERFNLLVRDITDDIFTVAITSSTENTATQINPIVERIKRVPIRVVNPWCGSNWNPERSGTKQLDGYVEPQKTVYYRLPPNYFYSSSPNRIVRIQSAGFGTINVCHSRSPLLNRLNDTQGQGEVTCTDLVSASTNVEINLQNFCEGHDYIHTCPPLFISIRAVTSEATTQYRCTDSLCRFPDSLRFTITTIELGCFSGSSTIAASAVLLILAFAANVRHYF